MLQLLRSVQKSLHQKKVKSFTEKSVTRLNKRIISVEDGVIDVLANTN